MRLSELEMGAGLPELRRTISQEKINMYAQASRDFNPIHIDEDFARQTPLGGTVAHGMLVLAYASQVMTAAFGQDWLTSGRLEARFKAPARPGDTVTVTGQISGIEKGAGEDLVGCDLLVSNQHGEPVLVAQSTVRVKADENSS